MTELSVVIVNYNTKDLLEECLASLLPAREELEMEVLVIDNASTDGSAAMVRLHHPWTQLIASDTNLGYAKAVNTALAQAKGRLLLIANADLSFRPQSLLRLKEAIDAHPKAGIVAPGLLNPDGSIQPSCRTFYNWKTILLRRTFLGRLWPNHPELQRYLMADFDHQEVRDVDWVIGACMLLTRSVLDRVGPMDERYFMYFEDVDWCYRMHQHGLSVLYVPQAEVVHHFRQGSRTARFINRDLLIHVVSSFRYLGKWSRNLYEARKHLSSAKVILLLLCDLAIIGLSFLLAYGAREALRPALEAPLGSMMVYSRPLMILIALLVSNFYLAGLYRLEGGTPFSEKAQALFKAMAVALVLGSLVLVLGPGYRRGFLHSRMVWILTLIFTAFGVALVRSLEAAVKRWFWKRRLFLKRVLLVGPAPIAGELARRMTERPEVGYEAIGRVALCPDPTPAPAMASIDELESLVERERASGVIFLDMDESYRDGIYQMVRCLERLVEVKVVISRFRPIPGIREEDFFELPSRKATRSPSYALHRAAQRTLDIVIALLALIALAPFGVLVGLLIRRDGQPALFRQTRIGRGGRPFTILKLRTMIPDAADSLHLCSNSAEGPLTYIPDDPRVTPLGRFLRRHKLDEIPQFINVLLGQMSVVGPRPPLPSEVELYEPWHRTRLLVKPGITGLWQVDKGRRWRFDEMVELDIRYIVGWSLGLDLEIMLRTLPAMWRGR